MRHSTGTSGGNARKGIAAGAAWMVGFKLTERSLGLISTVVLARLLQPSDFGIMAMAVSLIAVLELLTSFSFDVALIQRTNVERKHLDTAWTFNVAFGLGLAVALFASAPAAAAYYREPLLEAVVMALAAGWLLQGFENVGTVAFRRDLDFQREYKFLALKKVIGVLITVPLAIALKSYWALVIGVVASKAVSVALSYWMHPYRPRFSLAASSDLFRFSGWLFLNNLLYFLNQRFSDFVIGRVVGAQALGLFTVSHEISNMPTTDIAAPVNRALLPAYSKIAGERGELSEAYVYTVGGMALFTTPAGVGIAAIADPLVRTVLGPNWLGAIPLIQILGIYGTVNSIGTNTASALLALGKPRMLTSLAALRVCLLLPVLVASTHQFGLIGAAWAMLAVSLVVAPLNFLVLLPRLGVRIVQLIDCLWRPALAATVMYLLVTATLASASSSGLHNPLSLVAVGALTGAISYSAVVGLLWLAAGRPSGSERLVIDLIRSRFRRSSVG